MLAISGRHTALHRPRVCCSCNWLTIPGLWPLSMPCLYAVASAVRQQWQLTLR